VKVRFSDNIADCCPICYLAYDHVKAFPPQMMFCGHTVCKTCSTQIGDRCPICRNPLQYKKGKERVVGITHNYALSQLIADIRKTEYPQCETHRLPKRLICTSCLCLTCIECSHESHVGHSFKTIKPEFTGTFKQICEELENLGDFPTAQDLDKIREIHTEWTEFLGHAYDEEIFNIERLVNAAQMSIHELGEKLKEKVKTLRGELLLSINRFDPANHRDLFQLRPHDLKNKLLEAVQSTNVHIGNDFAPNLRTLIRKSTYFKTALNDNGGFNEIFSYYRLPLGSRPNKLVFAERTILDKVTFNEENHSTFETALNSFQTMVTTIFELNEK